VIIFLKPDNSIFNAEHLCNANGGAIPKSSNQRKTIKYISHQELKIKNAMSEKSCNYWHYRLGLDKVDQVPPLPVRMFE
jgi:hypothetical protein